MRIFYPYNEILPTGRAHDVYVMRNCASLAEAGLRVDVGIGRDSAEEHHLSHHYQLTRSDNFRVNRFPIVRKNNLFGISWNRPFFQTSQRFIDAERPDFVISSVRKQGLFHHRRKISGVRYLYEVHELLWWPERETRIDDCKVNEERWMLSQADTIVVTTPTLAKLLRQPPYSLQNRIEIIPLASSLDSLAAPCTLLEPTPLIAAYVGQLYPMQGVELLIDAIALTSGVQLRIVGGATEDVARIKEHAKLRGVETRVILTGFQPPAALSALLEDADLFLMPSKNILSKPHVAHTKLRDYVHLGRPMVAPDLQAVREQIPAEVRWISYEADKPISLAYQLSKISERSHLRQLQHEALQHAGKFSWKARSQSYADLMRQLLH